MVRIGAIATLNYNGRSKDHVPEPLNKARRVNFSDVGFDITNVPILLLIKWKAITIANLEHTRL